MYSAENFVTIWSQQPAEPQQLLSGEIGESLVIPRSSLHRKVHRFVSVELAEPVAVIAEQVVELAERVVEKVLGIRQPALLRPALLVEPRAYRP